MSWPWPPSCGCSSTSGTMTTTLPWDYGISWRTLRTVAPTDPLLLLPYVRDSVLRVVNGSVEDANIESLITAATYQAEDMTQRALMPQTWQMILSGFPAGDIVLERPPLIEVTELAYTDADGNAQTLAVSPLTFQVVTSGHYQKARLRPLVSESWPSVLSGEEAVTITYRAGYADETDPQLEWIKRGVAVLVGELYKQRSLTVVGTSIVPAPLDMSRFFKKVY